VTIDGFEEYRTDQNRRFGIFGGYFSRLFSHHPRASIGGTSKEEERDDGCPVRSSPAGSIDLGPERRENKGNFYSRCEPCIPEFAIVYHLFAPALYGDLGQKEPLETT